MNIGIDIDDTISDTYATLFPYAQKYTIEELHKTGRINEDHKCVTHKYVQAMHGWSEEDEQPFWEKYYEKCLSEVNIKAFAKEIIDKLAKDNKIVLITARWDNEEKSIQKLTKQWLKENEVYYDDIILDSQDKLKTAKEYNIDLFIDDSFANCSKIAEAGINTFMMDTKANSEYNDEKITRVYSWPHVYQEYEKIIKGEN